MSAAEDSMIHATRRDVLKGGAVLTVGLWLPSVGAQANEPAAAKAGTFVPNAFVRIGEDNIVTVLSKHTEMGQGSYTGLATIVAEELDADWNQIRVEGAPADAKLYNNLAFGPFQGTGGSTAIANSYEQLKNAGATARAMLVTAAANRWQVPANEITIASGVVQHKSGKSARFGELVADASKLPVPTEVKPKDPSAYNRIGKSAPRVDSRAKSTGKAIFTQDFKLPGMLTAVVAHPPRFGGKVKSFDASKAKEIKGVKSVVAFETPARSGVAVVATDFWAAKKGRDALSIEWDESNAFKQSSDEMLKQYRELSRKPGDIAKQEGDVEKAFASAARTFEATYEFPYLAHATMEPMNCVVQIGQGTCEVWNGEQFQTADQMAIATMLNIAPKDVKINQLFAGGSFGRRANPAGDYLVETVAIAKAIGTSDPVKLVWTREEDMRAGYYRPMYVHWLKAGVDAQGKIIAWQHRIVGQSITRGTLFDSKSKIDFTSVEGAQNLPYHVPNLLVELHTTEPQVPVLWWRSVGSTHTAFSTECFLDDIARGTKQDPCALRRSLLEKHPRHLAVLDLVAEKAGWNKKRATDEIYGLALHESFNSVVGQVAKLKKTPNGPKLVSVVCAVDCGIAVNPNIIAMQMESGIGYGLSAALMGAVTFKEGQVEQSNFDDYPVLRINEMPAVETHIVPSKNKPTGVGEPGTPVIAPALANALAQIDGKPIHALPLSAHGVKLA
ncbi:xanthine dehydrogenase family protein molybdopterin-binding subunit [Peristeroidobacter soli]|uniref:xanthine dehydrogenase family protein molybdopterin-binding subunit n=1 Tax=Peristeroidobacter soli TaxID=2497877 RepID=UPI00101C2511|nr:xanthine dehydrogenase family protein molybdopterin-binding subunit [Peristeroidobacter soli]